ncbi:1,4-beta-xylanase [Aureimonas flava]|uniref:Beta-xylanase n=1 Tax=Aureimonas flava TaxID=2320271 RepID=A0A3A1WQJ8_9HYPH|nr:endo-1,4-beta-xylanase [Aureimonas flava]RIY00048.1 1,4-beta-xylanase [Aureimonas flava]
MTRQQSDAGRAVPAVALHSGPILTRRSFLAGGAALAAGAPGPARAAANGIPFGAAIQAEYFEDTGYRDLFRRECDFVMPMNELKFALVQPERGRFDFDRADRLLDFAGANGQSARGTTFVWWSTNPPWLEAIADPVDLERALVEHIERVADHCKGRLASWDVVNEVIAHDPDENCGPLRDTFWLRRLGPRHIPIAFAAAARADPGARLVLNDYDLEFRGPRFDRRRAIVLSIVRQLQGAGIRIDAVGIQGHLYAHQAIDVEALARFGADLKAVGVALLATELDVIDFQVPGGPEEIDAAAGKVVGDFLDGLLGGQRPQTVITWGLTDRYNWVEDVMPRGDGQPCRPLPFDRELRPKPWYAELRRRLARG